MKPMAQVTALPDMVGETWSNVERTFSAMSRRELVNMDSGAERKKAQVAYCREDDPAILTQWRTHFRWTASEAMKNNIACSVNQ